MGGSVIASTSTTPRRCCRDFAGRRNLFSETRWQLSYANPLTAPFLIRPIILGSRKPRAGRIRSGNMANPQHEPTMEEILASIRKIIAEDPPGSEGASAATAVSDDESEVLDLTQEIHEEHITT